MTGKSPQQARTYEEPSAMYCRRLAEEAFAKSWKDPRDGSAEYVFDSSMICQAVFGSTSPLPMGDRENEIKKLSGRLLEDAKLQQNVAVLTDYVPSKWLLEQERAAKRDADGKAEWDGKTDIYASVAVRGLFGVGMSGGGIRSATFNLGVLQALAQLGMLPRIDYLSSVSGGGYIHQFLGGWLLRDEGRQESVIRKLIPQAEPGCLPRSPEPIKWLVRYASYLTPARGMFTADTWTMLAIWLRNTILNQIPILGGFAGAFFFLHLMLPVGMTATSKSMEEAYPGTGMPWGLWVSGLAVLAWVLRSLWLLGANLYRQLRISDDGDGQQPGHERKNQERTARLLTNTGVQWGIIVPWLAGALWMTFWTQFHRRDLWGHWVPMAVSCGLVLLAVLLVIFLGGSWEGFLKLNMTRQHQPPNPRLKAATLMGFVAIGLLTTATACVLGWGYVEASWRFAAWLSRHVGPIVGREPTNMGVREWAHIDPWRIQLVLLPAAMLSIPYVAIELTLGLLGRDFPETRREWLARLRAWSLLFGLGWSGVVFLVLVSPYLVYFLTGKGWQWASTTGAAFLVAHLTTVIASWSGKSDGKPTEKGIARFKPMDLVALIAGPIAIVSMLILISYLVTIAAELLQPSLGRVGPGWGEYWVALVAGGAATTAVAALFAWRVDINEFSMLSFYRNRLARCYLEATLNNRQPDPFTGFDDRTKTTGKKLKDQTIPPRVRDMLPAGYEGLRLDKDGSMAKGDYEGPFPIFCTTLNLTTGKELATQERKGVSFVFTPLYSGYSVSWTQGKKGEVSLNGFVPTEDYAYHDKGIHLDTAVAISGAAVNPNMGYNSNPALAFLMTFFNVRLGWWITNPRRRKEWPATYRPTPNFPGLSLLRELLGSVDDASRYVNLSDGGHFDNMGLYELVRRRCKYIIVCDAEADAEMKFAGMGTAIAKCRMDFGAEIDLDLRPLRIGEDGYSKTHCVVGTIQYPPPKIEMRDYGVDGPRACECLQEPADDKYTGTIVYLKSSLVGDEPADLLAYKLRHEVFPHDMTGDQWFTETQFESYRRLGHHVALTALQPALSPTKTRLPSQTDREKSAAEIDALFERMYGIWYPRTPEMEEHLSDHLKQYEVILTELRARVELAGLEAALNDPRSWSDAETVAWPAPSTPTLTQTASRAYALQFAHSLLDFMYTVYTNLELAFPDNRVSPHADWWMCLFRRWCRVELVRDAWLLRVAMFPMEFRLFARRELRLPKPDRYVE